MAITRRVILQLDLMTSDQQPIAGTVRGSDGAPHAFGGWSEMFAVLQVLTSDSGGDPERQDLA